MFNLKQFVAIHKLAGDNLEEIKHYVVAFSKNGLVGDLQQALARVELEFISDKTRNIASEVAEWVASTNGYISSTNVYTHLQLSTRTSKKTCHQALCRLVDAGVLVRVPQKGAGWYRKLEIETEEVDWQSASDKIVALKFPFGLEEYAKIYPKSIVIVAGGKNQGKTAFLLNVVTLNMDEFQVDLFNSETGREQLKKKFDNFGIEIPAPAPFKTYQRYDNFADVIDENRISVIDYMDVGSETLRVGDEIEGVFRKLKTGVAVIGLQKPPGSTIFVKGVKKYIERDLAYGGAFSSKRAILYISISEHKLKLLYVKEPAKANVNPNNMQWSFDIKRGVEFTDIRLLDSGSHDEELF